MQVTQKKSGKAGCKNLPKNEINRKQTPRWWTWTKHINSYLTCKWCKHSSWKVEIVRVNTEARPDTLQIYRHREMKVNVWKGYNMETVSKESWCGYINIRKIRYQENKCYQDQRGHFIKIKSQFSMKT